MRNPHTYLWNGMGRANSKKDGKSKGKFKKNMRRITEVCRVEKPYLLLCEAIYRYIDRITYILV